jgi:hypothetical protein
MKKIVLTLTLATALNLFTTSAKAQDSNLQGINGGLIVTDSQLGVSWANFVALGVQDFSGIQTVLNALNSANYGGYNDWTTPGNSNLIYLTHTHLGFNQSTGIYENLANSPFSSNVISKIKETYASLSSFSLTSFGTEFGGANPASSLWTGTSVNSNGAGRYNNNDGSYCVDSKVGGNNDLIIMRNGIATPTVPESSTYGLLGFLVFALVIGYRRFFV